MSRGEKDLSESPSKVRRWQETAQRKLAQFGEQVRPKREENRKLKELFPDLERLVL